MTPNHEELARLRQGFHSMADSAPGRPDCPDPERIWDAVAGRLPSEQVRELVDHTASCPGCAEAWRLARELIPEAPEEHSRVARPVFGTRGGWRWMAAAAAVVLSVAAVQLWRMSPAGGPPGSFRDAGSEIIRSLLVDGEALPRTGFLLRWTTDTRSVPRFDVRVATEDMQVIAVVQGLEEPEYLVPEGALEQLFAGDRVMWQVEAVQDDGNRAVSPTFVNRLE
jgi:hypothetical protein